VAKQARGGERSAVAEEAWLREVISQLQAGRPARGVPLPDEAPHALRDLGALTAKPVLFVANVDEGTDEVPAAVAEHAAAEGARAVAISSRIEAELAELDEEEAAAMREELMAHPPAGSGSGGATDGSGSGTGGSGAGTDESGGLGDDSPLDRVIRGAFSLLRLIAFFTAGESKPAQSWHLRDGLTAWHAAGQIHTDIQKGFVRAEVAGWRELVDAGGYAGARERGTLRLEGRDYVMRDGDAITIKFTP
jgi:ribosome-binding ATPase YchF (GTP1/OBG family)